jgi:hypothetical protein
VRAGTANSDTHTLLENIVGTPRTIVWTDAVRGPAFDMDVFDASVKKGTSMGTNGPIISVSTVDATSTLRIPSVEPFTPDEAGSVRIEVRAAPWVPVPEVRITVNGEVKKVITDLAVPGNPLATGGEAITELDRLSTTVPMSELLAGVDGDAWIVVEAGIPEIASADLDCDGWPDTGDNNGDGTIDWHDVATATAAPEGCFDVNTAGPLGVPTIPEDPDDPLYLFSTVVPNGFPLSFTNPLLLDRDGNGRFDGVK